MEVTSQEKWLLSMYEGGDWKTILQSCQQNKFLPWIWPSLENLEFIGDCVRGQKSSCLVSIGCGSGLLEWLIAMSTDIKVCGVEMDQSWWTSRYAEHTFIPMVFVKDGNSGHEVAASSNVVLLFCYFNNEKAFLEYITQYKGNCFIVIGPGEGRHTRTAPEPFVLPETLNQFWTLSKFQEIGNSKDFIAAYMRT